MPVDPNKQRVAIRYQADDGNFYSLVTTRNHAIAVGATGALAADPPLPTKWKPRTVNLLQVLNGRDRTMQVAYPNQTDGVWTGGVNTLTVQPYGALEITGRTGERRTIGAPGFDGVANPPDERVSIRYNSDNGQSYSLVTTRERAAALLAASGAGFPSFPEVWTPRHYNLISPTLTGRDQKLVLVEPAEGAQWTSDAAITFNIGGVDYRVTGRKQEDRPRGAPPFVP